MAHQQIDHPHISHHEPEIRQQHDVYVDIPHHIVEAEVASLQGEADEGTLQVCEAEIQELMMQVALVRMKRRESFGDTHCEDSGRIEEGQGHDSKQYRQRMADACAIDSGCLGVCHSVVECKGEEGDDIT